MTHLESLIAKAKAAMPGARQVYDANEGDSNPPRPLWCVANDAGMPQNEDEDSLPFHATVDMGTKDDASFIAHCHPHLILALCELAMAAEEVFAPITPENEGPNNMGRALMKLDAKLAAVRGVGGI